MNVMGYDQELKDNYWGTEGRVCWKLEGLDFALQAIHSDCLLRRAMRIYFLNRYCVTTIQRYWSMGKIQPSHSIVMRLRTGFEFRMAHNCFLFFDFLFRILIICFAHEMFFLGCLLSLPIGKIFEVLFVRSVHADQVGPARDFVAQD